MSWRDRCGAYVGVAELKDRGWTVAMIKSFLGQPDDTAPNPGGPRAPRVKLWLSSRVDDAEAMDAFRQRLAQATARRTAQRGPARTPTPTSIPSSAPAPEQPR